MGLFFIKNDKKGKSSTSRKINIFNVHIDVYFLPMVSGFLFYFLNKMLGVYTCATIKLIYN